jgi:hypothetical protein
MYIEQSAFEKHLINLNSLQASLKNLIESETTPIFDVTDCVAEILKLLRTESYLWPPKLYYHIFKNISENTLQIYHTYLIDSCMLKSSSDAERNHLSADNLLELLFNYSQTSCFYVLPRIYIQIIITVIIILRGIQQSSMTPTKIERLLSDLKSFLFCVQHPLEGLFVRHYFNRVLKDISN